MVSTELACLFVCERGKFMIDLSRQSVDTLTF